MAASFVRWKTGLVCPRTLRALLSQVNRAGSIHPSSQQAASCATSTTHGSYHPPAKLISVGQVKPNVKPEPSPPDLQASLNEEPLHEEEGGYRERYIPITRQSLIRYIVQEQSFLSDKDKKVLPDFAVALDNALVSRYNNVLQELKVLFDPINPDKDTVKTRELTRGEKLDNEFWLLQRLEDVMEKANFYELPQAKIEQLLSEHQAGDGVRVSVNPERYAVLRFWVLGHEEPEMQLSLWKKLVSKVTGRAPPSAPDYYKRVVVAIRLKKDSKLILKAFKEVPSNCLEMLLPDGTIKMSTMDKGILSSSLAIALFGVVAKGVTVLNNMNVDWTLILTGVTGVIAFRAWSLYKNRRNAYLVNVQRMLYFKSIANNRGLLTLLVDRAEDETFKEVLLTYMFLLKSRPLVPDAITSKPIKDIQPNLLGGLTEDEIKQAVERWIKLKTGVKLDFDTEEAINLLKNLGLLIEKDDKYHVLLLDAARRVLPQSPLSVIARRSGDASEGYDRDEYLETEEEYKAQDQKARRYGWL